MVVRILLGGVGLGLLGAAVTGIAGLSGRVGFVVAALLAALGAVAAAFVGTVLAIVDEARSEHVSRTRVALILCLYAASAVTVIALGSLVSE